MVPGFSSVHLPSLQPRDHPPRLRGEVVEPATLFAIRVVRYRLVEREGVASRLEAVAPIGAPERRRPADQRDGAPAGQTAEPEEEPGVGGGHVHTSPLIQKIGSAPPTTHGCATAGIGRTISGKSWQPMRTRSAHAPPFGPRASWRMISGSGVIAWSGGACRAS